MSLRKNLLLTAASVVLLGASGVASAIPELQLTIDGGDYAGCPDDTTCATSSSFDLYGLATPGTGGSNKIGDPTTGTFYLSIAVIPRQTQTTPAPDYGYFTINGTKIFVTADMVYGTPPDPCLGSPDSSCLSPHSIFETYYKQIAFTAFDLGEYEAGINVQDDYDQPGESFNASTDLVSGTGLWARKWTIDVSGLTGGIQLHFDLYTADCAVKLEAKTYCDLGEFAPYSKDAQSASSSSSSGTPSTSGNVPEPNSGSLALLGLAMLGTAFGMRRRKLNG